MIQTPKVELISVCKRFGKTEALDSLSLTVMDGEYFCLLGPTGAGKTTTLKVAAGLVEPDRGSVVLDGMDVTKMPPEEREMSYMSQSFDLFPHLDIQSNVSYGPVVKGASEGGKQDVATRFLRMVRLESRVNSMPNELSGGMQQRVALARALASGARVFLFDEPLASLDARLRVELRMELRKMAKDQGATVIHVTHDQEEAVLLADRLAILRRGKVTQVGSPADVYMHPNDLFAANFISESNFIEVRVLRVRGGTCTFSTPDGTILDGVCRGAEEGRRAVLAVRSEDIRLRDSQKSNSVSLPGTVVDVRFLGHYERIVVDLGFSRVVCRSFLSESSSAQSERGHRVHVFMPPENCILYAYPKSGLLSELEVI